ncbi:MAG: NRDE family protein [Sandaracinaceae bacterium]
MCTILALKGVHPAAPLIIAANRDEYYARTASEPVLVHDAPRAIAGIDAQGGGTWMGANERGIFAGLTNQREWSGAEADKRSRGELVMRAIECESVDAIEAYLRTIDPRRYNSFNLMYGDASTLRVAYGRRDRPELEVVRLDDGLWVLPNDRVGSVTFEKVKRAETLLEGALPEDYDALVLHLKAVLGDHDKTPLERIEAPPADTVFTRELVRELTSICIHTAHYGTRSSTIVALTPGALASYRYAEGPACVSELRDYTSLVR